MSMIGKTLAHYRLTSEIGRGGMGEVYQAKDTKLGRDVAIKVLPEELARDTDRIARFQREAKLLASLNHPNIAAIYGLEKSDDTHFLVMELIGGQTLADRIKAGAIPVEESLKLALQIAEALEAAHEKGVIHRDLKPANIKVTPDGKVKVLDFGLAKAFTGEQQVNLSNSPTLSEAATQQGVILGTAAYMSPEQARGKPVDKRTDVWAFGCVLYEMLSGKAAFQGEDVTEILAAVVKSGVNLDLLPSNIHPRVREVITRCLQKEQKRRYSAIGDVQYEIEQVLADPSGLFAKPGVTAKPRKKLKVGLPWLAAAIVLSLIVAGVAVWYLKPSEPRRVTRLSHELPKDQQFGNLTECAFAVSPDGRQFVYSTTEGLYHRSMDELDAKIIPGTGENPQKPFFSPDGKWVGYVAGNQLKKIAISGGAPSVITEASTIGYIDWQTDDTNVFSQPGTGIMRISANGGNPEAIVKAENELIISPQILPDGKSVLYTSLSLASTNIYSICVQSLESGERRELFPGNTARYLPTGHIVYAVDNDLFAIRFDPDKLEVISGPVSVVEGIFSGAAPQYAVSNSGTLIYMPGTSADAGASARTLVWVDRNGKEEPIAVPPDLYSHPRISPDGRLVALTVGNITDSDIWIWDLVRKNLSPLTRDPSPDAVPLWTADGKRIAFMSWSGGSGKIYLKSADGTGKVEPLGSDYGGALLSLPSSWSGDGKELVFMGLNLMGAVTYDIGAVEMEGERKFRPLLKEKYLETEPKISPNGQWMAYTSDVSGKNEIYVRPFPDVDSGGKWTVSTGGGTSPLWAPDGRELFYRNGDAVMAVSVKTETTFSPETPKTLFRGTYVSLSSGIAPLSLNSWDISQDGKRFLMLKPGASTGEAPVAAGPRRINVVLNWFEELKGKVPVN